MEVWDRYFDWLEIQMLRCLERFREREYHYVFPVRNKHCGNWSWRFSQLFSSAPTSFEKEVSTDMLKGNVSNIWVLCKMARTKGKVFNCPQITCDCMCRGNRVERLKTNLRVEKCFVKGVSSQTAETYLFSIHTSAVLNYEWILFSTDAKFTHFIGMYWRQFWVDTARLK